VENRIRPASRNWLFGIGAEFRRDRAGNVARGHLEELSEFHSVDEVDLLEVEKGD
jgi:hypothetical protein